MPQINAGDFRKGIKVVVEGEPYEMTECNFVKPGKGQALYKTRLRNLLKGTLLDRTYKSGDGLEEADIHKSDGQFLYRAGDELHFMDNESFEQYTLSADQCGDGAKFLLENATVGLMYWNGRLIEMTPPAASRPHGDLYRAGGPRQYGHEREQAGDRGNRRDGPRARIHQSRGQNQSRRPHRVVH